MLNLLFTSLYSGLLLSLAILGGIVLSIESNIIARIIGGSFLIICPILSVFIIQLSITTKN